MDLTVKSCFNPFFVTVNGREYQLKEIVFYNKDGQVIRIPRGWFDDKNGYSSNNEFRQGLHIELECIEKRKVDYNLTKAFIIPIKPTYGFERSDHGAALYLPYDVFHWNITRDAKYKDFTTTRQFYDTYENLTLGFKQVVHTRTEPLSENVEFINKLTPLAALICNDKVSNWRLVDNRKAIETEIAKLTETQKEERPTLDKITIVRQTEDDPDLSWLQTKYNADTQTIISSCRYTNEDVKKYTWPKVLEWIQQDEERLRTYGQTWIMIGIYAAARISYAISKTTTDRRLETFRSAGLYGIESDNKDDYFKEVETEQLNELKDHLAKFQIDLNKFEELAKNAERVEI